MSFQDEISKIPPVTRFMVISAIAVSLSSILNFVSGYSLIFTWSALFKGEVWKLYTSFFLAGSGIPLIFNLVMLYRTSLELETSGYHSRVTVGPRNYAYHLILTALAILAISYPLYPFLFFRPLLLSLAYVTSAMAPPGATTSFFGLITFPQKYYPYVILGLDLISEGPSSAAVSMSGLIAGHLWWWGVWGPENRGGWLGAWAEAPWWVSYLVNVPAPRETTQGGVQAVAPRRMLDDRGEGSTAASRGTSRGTSGHVWGSGQTLGNK